VKQLRDQVNAAVPRLNPPLQSSDQARFHLPAASPVPKFVAMRREGCVRYRADMTSRLM